MMLRAHFDAVQRDLDQAVGQVDEADLGWAPAPGMPTIRGLLLEIANKETETIGWINAGRWPDEAPDNFHPETATLDEIKAKMAANRQATFDWIDSMSDEELHRPVSNPNRWNEGFHLEQCPLSEVLHFIASHEWYHTGQLVTYLWIRGKNPNEW
ncbi:MAG TPA: DinB family protein [Fimbriimonadaceae bacterium]|nr:DinB family protein [Fimbriimonadaceae bacterium]